MKTFVLCGGEGTRLRPYTYTTPKPMLAVAGKPILQYMIENLKENGLTDLILTVGYKKEQVIDYFGDGKKFGVKIEYLSEDTPKGTAGGIREYKDRIKETFAVVMGDQITSARIKGMIEHHKKNKPLATMALVKNSIPLEVGIATLEGGKVTALREKPVIENNVNIAMYVFEPKVFEYINEKEDFAKHVFPRLLEKGERVNGYIIDDTWFDVGRTQDYERLDELFKVVKLANKPG